MKNQNITLFAEKKTKFQIFACKSTNFTEQIDNKICDIFKTPTEPLTQQ